MTFRFSNMFQTKTNIKCKYSDRFLAKVDHFPCTKTLKVFDCTNCGYWTLQEHVFDSHVCTLSKTPKISFCEKCNNFFTHSLLVMMKHTNEKCKFEKTTKFKSLVQPHVQQTKTCSKTTMFRKCDLCDFKTVHRFALKRHKMAIHEGIKEKKREKFLCEKCPYTSRLKYKLNKHIFTKHSSEDVQWLECDKCFYGTQSKEILQQHVKKEHPEPDDFVWFQCELCLYRSKTKRCLQRHIREKHRNPKNIVWYLCDHCEYRSKERNNWRRHVREKHTDFKDNEWFQCEQCPYKSKRKDTLRQHLKAQHGDPKDFVWLYCEQCDHKVRKKRSLKHHMATKHISFEEIT